MLRSELTAFLSSYLALGDYDDMSTNGLVVGAPEDKEIRRVATAVDANLATFRMAIEWNADLLFTHHGLFWGHPLAVTGAHYTRLRTLMEGNLDLFVCHLPLDGHAEVGNNVQMAKILGLGELKRFAPFRGVDLGWWGTSARALSVEEITRKLGFSHPFVLPYGPKEIHTVGFVSGGGSDDVAMAMALGLDCFVTGAAAHEQAADCEECGITMIGGGHYASEVFGVQAVGRLLHEKFGLETTFLAHDTGL